MKNPSLKKLSWYYNFSRNSTNSKKVQGSLRSQLWPGQNKNLRSNIKCQHSHLIQYKTILSINLNDPFDSLFEFCAQFVLETFWQNSEDCNNFYCELSLWVRIVFQKVVWYCFNITESVNCLERIGHRYYILKHVFQDAEMSKKKYLPT